MELIKTLRAKRENSKQKDIRKLAEDRITLDDFDDKVYIAYNGVPFVPVEESWTTNQIISKLKELRENFANAMLKDHKSPAF